MLITTVCRRHLSVDPLRCLIVSGVRVVAFFAFISIDLLAVDLDPEELEQAPLEHGAGFASAVAGALERPDVVITRAERNEDFHIGIVRVVHHCADRFPGLFAGDDQVKWEIDDAVLDIRIAMERGNGACEKGFRLAAAIAPGGHIAHARQIPEATQMKIEILAGFD